MKKRRLFKRVILFFSLVISLTSCYQSYDDEILGASEKIVSELDNSTETIESESRFSSWKECLDYFVGGEGRIWLQKQNVKLINYEVISENQTLLTSDLNVSDKTIVPIYRDTCDKHKFDLMSVSDIRKFEDPAYVTNYSVFKENLLTTYVGKKITVVRLSWEYNQRQYETICYATANSVIYDDFLMNIRTIEVIKHDDLVIPTTLQLTRGETGGESIHYFFFSDEVTWNVLGAYVARAFCTLTVYGRKTSGGNSIESYTPDSHTTSKVGFKAIAQINVPKFVTGTSGCCEYGFGIAAGPAGISITWNGTSASFTGGGNTRGGGGYVQPSYLQ